MEFSEREDILREPGLVVGNKLDHYNEMLESVLEIMEDLEEADAPEETHIRKRETEKWLTAAEEAKQHYQDATYILDLLDHDIPAKSYEEDLEIDFEWDNPEQNNSFYKAYTEHEKQRESSPLT